MNVPRMLYGFSLFKLFHKVKSKLYGEVDDCGNPSLCAQGVLCEAYRVATGEGEWMNGQFRLGDETEGASMPLAVREWYGLPRDRSPVDDDIGQFDIDQIMQENDGTDRTLSRIADEWIPRLLERADKQSDELAETKAEAIALDKYRSRVRAAREALIAEYPHAAGVPALVARSEVDTLEQTDAEHTLFGPITVSRVKN